VAGEQASQLACPQSRPSSPAQPDGKLADDECDGEHERERKDVLSVGDHEGEPRLNKEEIEKRHTQECGPGAHD
jgi:hypothetical protein